jgi:peroxiredoxin/outer membrane biosynthesis protein TonB
LLCCVSLALSHSRLAAQAPQPASGEQPAQQAGANPAEAEKADELLAGHSLHGEVFNEGPRQKAYLMGGTGNVRFPVTSQHGEVQKFVEQGVGQLFGFWYFEAERSFRHAAMLDPDCAIAYWGAAMANLGNENRAKGFLAEAVKRKAKAGRREVMYIDAIDAYLKAGNAKRKERAGALATAYEEIALAFPEDLEAKAFLALQLYNNKSAGVAVQSNLAADALMLDIFKQEPLHPAHHFRIHLWDAKKAENALTSAASCGQGSPGIAHMWHMPGHIYSRVKRYEDACWQQEASTRVDHAHMMRDRVLPDRIHNFAHNNEWLIRNLINVGRVDDAIDLSKNMIELPRHPKYNTLKRGSSMYGRQRLLQVLSRFERWPDVIALAQTPYLEPTDDEGEQVKRLRWLGTAYFATGDKAHGAEQLAELERRLADKTAAQQKAVDAAEAKARGTGASTKPASETKPAEEAPPAGEKPAEEAEPDDPKPPEPKPAEEAKPAENPKPAESKPVDNKKIEAAKTEAKKPFIAMMTALTKAVDAVKGHQALAAEDYKSAYELLKKAGDEDGASLARVRYLAGQKNEAEADLRREVARRQKEVLPLAFLVDVLWQQGKKDEARKTFEELRAVSGSIDLDSSVFARLAGVAKELNLPDDWRLPRTPPTDVGERPTLDSLGPFRWQPTPASSWTLKDAGDQSHSLADWHGKPMVLILYLGHGCLHCVQQLHAFDPKYDEFRKAGLEVVAIGSDDRESLNRALDNYTGEKFQTLLLSDTNLDVFKAYRAYDDFEQQPLHGTFIIDGDGRVRWQDIGYEPFMDVNFVLAEAQRLLAQDHSLAAKTEKCEQPAK